MSRAQGICNGDGYVDYRKVIDRSDIDAVLIATPDHWHAKIAMDAIEAGKHVYVEKPMTHTVEQAMALRDAVRRHKKILQVGPQATGKDGFWQAHTAINAGRIGKVTWAQGSYNRNARVCLFNEHQKIDPTAGPDKTGEDHIDWDMWLGHAGAWRPRSRGTPSTSSASANTGPITAAWLPTCCITSSPRCSWRSPGPTANIRCASTLRAGSTSRKTAGTSPTPS